jgi:superfamily II DNA or RNA helicase
MNKRRCEIQKFKDSKRAIICSARIFGEGVNIPICDSICFAENKSSSIDIVQYLGRCLRLCKEKPNKLSNVIIPFYLNKDNNRAMFGGGRYNSLADIFGQKSFPAVGFAPGDETTKLFLESWDLLGEIKKEDKYYLPLLDESLKKETALLVKTLRQENYNVEEGLEVIKVGKALEYANKKNINKVIILGDKEYKNKEYKIKDMKSGEEFSQQFN